MTADPSTFRFVSTNRRVREDRRFVAGHGHFVADVALEGMLHVAVLPSQHPAARIVSIDASAALAMPGVHYVLTGDELAAATDPLMNGLDTPKVRSSSTLEPCAGWTGGLSGLSACSALVTNGSSS